MKDAGQGPPPWGVAPSLLCGWGGCTWLGVPIWAATLLGRGWGPRLGLLNTPAHQGQATSAVSASESQGLAAPGAHGSLLHSRGKPCLLEGLEIPRFWLRLWTPERFCTAGPRHVSSDVLIIQIVAMYGAPENHA